MTMEDSPVREHRNDDLDADNSSKHRRKNKEHRSKDRSKRTNDEASREKEVKDSERDRASSRDRRKEDRDEHDKDRHRDTKLREKDYDRDNKHREKERDRERERDRKDRGKDMETEKESDRGRDKDRGKEKNRDRDKEKERDRDRAKDKDREKHKDREREREVEKDRERGKEKIREKEKELDREKERPRDGERGGKKSHEDDYESRKDVRRYEHEDTRDRDEEEQKTEGASGGVQIAASHLEERIMKMREGRLMKKAEGDSEVLSWVSKSRKLEEKRTDEKEKALQRLRIIEEMDSIVEGGAEDEEASKHATYDLAGVKVLDGLDKVIQGGAVVLTLKDRNILGDGDINDDADMLENVEIGEQKRRDEAYKAAKKKPGIYDDKFNDDPGLEKKMLAKYDDPVADEGVTLDAMGRFTGEAEKKLEELRRRLQGPVHNPFEDLSSSAKISSDYFTNEEMLRFKKPKKKKALRKRDKLDINALEAEAVAAGLGSGDLGSRNDGRRQAHRQEQERAEAEMRSKAYQLAYAKADEASKSLQLKQTLPAKLEEEDSMVFADDEDDLYKSLERTRKLALKKQEQVASGPQAVALLANSVATSQAGDIQSGEVQENKVVFTEMEEFVWGLQLDEEDHKPEGEDVFMDEDEAPKPSDPEMKNEDGGWTEVKDSGEDEDPSQKDNEDITPDETIHEVAVGKGLSGALKLFKERGALKESIEWGGRNMDKKKSKLVGIADNDGHNDKYEIRIERLDEFGRIMTPKEAFRMISHKFHGKGPGKMKQEKRQKQFQDELKLKQMKNSDTPSLSVERMREAQARMQTPYLVLSGHVKSDQTSDPRNGFGNVEKDDLMGLTPMLGDKKVEHFLGIKRKAEVGNASAPKKPKT